MCCVVIKKKKEKKNERGERGGGVDSGFGVLLELLIGEESFRQWTGANTSATTYHLTPGIDAVLRIQFVVLLDLRPFSSSGVL